MKGYKFYLDQQKIKGKYIKKCQEITEHRARKIHPKLFKRLDE